jgi:hypothetical protein
MATEKYNARDVIFQAQDPGTGLWVQINGLKTFSKGRAEVETKTTNFASGGNSESQIMERTKTMKLEGERYKDTGTGVLDPGQQLVETLADQVGDASVGGFRFAAPGDTTWEVWQATAKLGDEGGDENAKVSWSVTYTRTGASTTAPRP